MVEIFNIDYNEYVDIVGTAHFTRRSINDAYESIKSLNPKDVAIELDWRRFQHLNTACLNCPKSGSCKGLCEFTRARARSYTQQSLAEACGKWERMYVKSLKRAWCV